MTAAQNNRFFSPLALFFDQIATADDMAIMKALTTEGVKPIIAAKDNRQIPKPKTQTFFDILIDLNKHIKNTDIIEICRPETEKM